MSLVEDDSFCHYCGQKSSVEVRLEWDHVPALNVAIPDYAVDIRKTLIRSCQECNGLASDVPHLDYLERHLWLKGALLRRYKRLLLAYDGKEVSTLGLDERLTATINNGMFRYDETMRRIGFGIRDVSDIESPILELKNNAKIKLREALTAFMYGIPTEQEDDKPSEDFTDIDADEDIKIDLPPYPYTDFIDFLASEIENGSSIKDDKTYFSWCKKYPSRTELLELPSISPAKYFGKSWETIFLDSNKQVTLIEFDEETEDIESIHPPKKIDTYSLENNKRLNVLQKRKRIYELYGKDFYIKQIGLRHVFYRCAIHGDQVTPLDAMLEGLCCCSQQ
ncbi:hypothetical protein [Vibrio zhugei]|uniref:hypothetical protein n=1 Tax=Vibrio zhugei TaxID=2479546 RepID=UPI0013DF2DE1|nr:hypothetical protein [Vibrio zhugei]